MAKPSSQYFLGLAAAVGAALYFAKDIIFPRKKKDIDPSAPAIIAAKKGSSPRVGDKGEAEVAWQRKLCAYAVQLSGDPSLASYLNKMTGWDDGKFDDDVAEWTRFFQGQSGLTDDGLVGPKTVAARDKALPVRGLDPKKVAQDKGICG